MTTYVLNHLNWLAILIAAASYWILGALWFGLLFGKVWAAELEKSGVKMQPPTGGVMARMYTMQFVYNLLAVIGVAIVVVGLSVTETVPALKTGLVLGVLIAGATQLQTLLWSGRSMKSMAIDLGYPVLGITMCSLILAAWPA